MADDHPTADNTPNGDADEDSPVTVNNENGEETSDGDEASDTEEPSEATTEDMAEETSTEPSLSATDSVAEEDVTTKNVLFNTMRAGFSALRQRHDNPNRSFRTIAASEQDHVTGPLDSCVSVNFIDPTTSGSGNEPSSPTKTPPPRRQNFSLLSQLSSASESSSKDLAPALDLYEKLTTIFERDYRSTLHSIPYENIRNGARGTIEKLKLRPVLTRSHGVEARVGSLASGDAMVPWGGNAATAAAPVSDPAEWHNGPYCHVYIAACQSMEHYRSKVKPSLQAFVSQIESAANSGSQVNSTGWGGSEDMSTSGNYSPHYVIVYVPTGPKPPAGMASPASPEVMPTRVGAFASRLSAARRRLENTAAASSREVSQSMSTDSIHSQQNSTDGTDTDYDSSDLAAAPPPGPVTHSSKLEKELYRKFTTDFPAGQTCIMSTLVDSVDDTSVATMSPLKNQEWNTFLHMLGSAIVSGFKDRCRRYDEELRRLDAHRATSPPSSKSWKDAPRFNLSHFFLVKESLAFTYEQMRLPEDALLQYEELRAFVPEPVEDEELIGEGDDYDGHVKKKKKSKSKRKVSDADMDEVMALAIAGNSAGFRRRLRATTHMAPLAEVVLQYMFARETSLLFQMDAPVEVINRAYAFVTASYRTRRRKLDAIMSKLSEERILKERAKTERWALNFCWDVKCACDVFFSESDMMGDEGAVLAAGPTGSTEDDGDNMIPAELHDSGPIEGLDMSTVHAEKDLAKTMGELLEFARNRMINLGDAEFSSSENPVRALQNSLPPDTMKPWPPLASTTIDEDDQEIDTPGLSEDACEGRIEPLLDGAFDSVDAYTSKYLVLVDAVASFSRFAGRRRFASKLDGERAEIYIRRGDLQAAAGILLPIVDVCSADRWDRSHFWRLFRLTCCQRAACNRGMYLSTLTHCFGQHITPVAPPKTLELLQRDFEVIVDDPRVADFPLGIAPFLETELVINPTSSGKSTMPLPYMRKKVINNFCVVGESTTYELTISSYLPNAIEVQAIKLFVVAFEKYEALFHSKTTITDTDVFKILSLESPISIEPGTNKYSFNWVPMNTGQYILSTVQIQWKQACFYYDSAALRRPLLGVNVLPSDPTQTLEMNPLFLIPGHVQQVRVTFNSGSDYIREGTISLLGFEGLQLVPPGTDPRDGNWSRSCEIDLSACPPGEKLELTTFVKSSEFHSGGVQGMQAKVATSYCHALYSELSEDEKESTPAMKTVLEATVSTLDRPALSIDGVSAFAYAKDRFMVSVKVQCNTPLPFFVKEWDVKLPKLRICDAVNLNQDLFGHAVSEGEQILFSFDCYKDGEADGDDSEPSLHISLEDEFGKTLEQVLPLDLDQFYEQLSRENKETSASHITAELRVSCNEGLVGAPVAFTYTINVGGLGQFEDGSSTESSGMFSMLRSSPSASPKSKDAKSSRPHLLYAVTCDDSEWILSGKTRGVIDCLGPEAFSLKFVGIPVRPGLLKSFPEIRLNYDTCSESAPPIDLRCRLPSTAFDSLPFLEHTALACPANDED